MALFHWPAWLLLNSTAKWWAFWTSRTLTWSGFYAMRKKLRAMKLWWLVLLLANLLSLGVLALLFFLWHRHRHAA